jgi:fucose permease
MFYRNLDTKDIICWFITAFGSFMFVPAAQWSFPFFLTALFTVGLGFQFSKLLLIH